MLVHRNYDLHWELLKWLAILSLAMATAIAFATRAASGSEVADQQNSSPAFGEDAAQYVWMLLDQHRQGDWEKVIRRWTKAPLPAEMQTWKYVAICHARLHLAQSAVALAALDRAERIAAENGRTGENAVVCYLRAICRLQQASQTEEWYEPPKRMSVMFASHQRVVPNTPSMYRLAAIADLNRAIRHARHLTSDDPLVPMDWPTQAALLPTVGDLLIAIDASDFEARAERTLGYLHLADGRLEMAEAHLDGATAMGLTIGSAYSDLGERYESRGRYTDAARAFAKATSAPPRTAVPGSRALDNMFRSLWDLW